MKSPDFVHESIFFRTPMAIALGSVTFMVGFFRLVRLSTQFTTLMIRGDSPAQALSKLERKRQVNTLESY